MIARPCIRRLLMPGDTLQNNPTRTCHYNQSVWNGELDRLIGASSVTSICSSSLIPSGPPTSPT